MYAMKLLALGAAMALSTFGEADAMKLLGKKGPPRRAQKEKAPAATATPVWPPTSAFASRPQEELRKIQEELRNKMVAIDAKSTTTGGNFATKAKAAAGAIGSRVKAIGKNSSLRKVRLVVLVLLIAFVIFAAATGSTWCTGPIEGTPDELVKRDFNDGTDSEHANGQFMTEYVDLDGNRADFEQVNVYVYDSQSAYLDARDNYAEVGEHIFVGVNDDGGTVIRGANIEVEGIDVNYHRQVLTGWENYGTRNMANLHVRAY